MGKQNVPNSGVKGTLVIKQCERCLSALSDLWKTSVMVEMEIWHHRYDDESPCITLTIKLYRVDRMKYYKFADFLELHKFTEKEVSNGTSKID